MFISCTRRCVLPGKVKPKPNYRVKHINGYTVNIFITPTVIKNLNGRDDNRRKNAMDHICIKVRKSFEALYSNFTNQRIEWGHLSIISLEDTPKPESGKQGYVCDDDKCCASCEQGFHERCSKGCVRGRPRR